MTKQSSSLSSSTTLGGELGLREGCDGVGLGNFAPSAGPAVAGGG